MLNYFVFVRELRRNYSRKRLQIYIYISYMSSFLDVIKTLDIDPMSMTSKQEILTKVYQVYLVGSRIVSYGQTYEKKP